MMCKRNSWLFILMIILSVSCRNKNSQAEEIRRSFDSVNATLSATVQSANASIEAIMDSITNRTSGVGGYSSANSWKEKAVDAREISGTLISYLEQLKKPLYKAGQDDLATVEKLLIQQGKGSELHKKLQQYNNDLLTLDANYLSLFKSNLPVNLIPPKSTGANSWEEAYFKTVPAFAAITLLSKFQNDVRNAEMQFVQYCLEQVRKNN